MSDINDTVNDIRRENADQNQRIVIMEVDIKTLHRDVSDMTGELRELKTTIIGIDGQNGLRREVRKSHEQVEDALASIRGDIARMPKQIIGSFAGIATVISAVAVLIALLLKQGW